MPPPATDDADRLQGTLGRITAAELTAIAASVIQTLDLQVLEPWQCGSVTPSRRSDVQPGCFR
jgi:hypothetical protein